MRARSLTGSCGFDAGAAGLTCLIRRRREFESMTMQEYTMAVMDGLADGNTRDRPCIPVRVIVSLNRSHTVENSRKLIDLACRFRPTGEWQLFYHCKGSTSLPSTITRDRPLFLLHFEGIDLSSFYNYKGWTSLPFTFTRDRPPSLLQLQGTGLPPLFHYKGSNSLPSVITRDRPPSLPPAITNDRTPCLLRARRSAQHLASRSTLAAQKSTPC